MSACPAGSPTNLKVPKHLRNKKRVSKFSPEAKSKKAKSSVNYVRFHHVTCQESPHLHGFAITMDGWADRELAQPLYDRQNPIYAQALEFIDPVSLVFRGINSDGSVMMRTGTQNPVNLIIILPGTEAFEGADPVVINSEYCKTFFEETLLPAMLTYATFRDGAEPVWSDEHSYRTLRTWSNILSNADVIRLIRLEMIGQNSTYNLPSVEFFFKMTQANIYACWGVGNVPPHIIAQHHLVAANLEQADWLPAWLRVAAQAFVAAGGNQDEEDIALDEVEQRIFDRAQAANENAPEQENNNEDGAQG
jgi:hypothetical protein